MRFKEGEGSEELDLDGSEHDDSTLALKTVTFSAEHSSGRRTTFITTVRQDAPVDLVYYKNSGTLQTILPSVDAAKENSRC